MDHDSHTKLEKGKFLWRHRKYCYTIIQLGNANLVIYFYSQKYRLQEGFFFDNHSLFICLSMVIVTIYKYNCNSHKQPLQQISHEFSILVQYYGLKDTMQHINMLHEYLNYLTWFIYYFYKPPSKRTLLFC